MAKKPIGTFDLVDNPHVREVFVTQAVHFTIVAASNVSITLTSARWSSAKQDFQNVVTERLVMPIVSAQAFAVKLNDFLVKQGHDPSAAVSGGEPRQ